MSNAKDTFITDNRITVDDDSSSGVCQHSMGSIKRIFRALPDAILCVDYSQRIIMLNPAMEDILGYREDELLGQQHFYLYGSKEEYEATFNERLRLPEEEAKKPYVVKLKKKDGTFFSAEVTSSVVKGRDGDTIFFLHLMRDITERKRLEDQLRELEQKYRTVADFAYDWECWRLPDGGFKFVSPSCERITGYTASQFMSYPGLLRDIIVPEDRDLWDRYQENLAVNMKQEALQFRILRRDGDIRWVEHVCQPVIGKNHELLGYRTSNRDITKRKLNENELRQALFKIKEYQEQLEAESVYLREEMKRANRHADIIGGSNAIQYVFFKIEQIAANDTSVLLLGETGTGKELIARAIHTTGTRSDRPLIIINCATLPANLIESELFGHEKGSFTSAHSKQIGRFELADKGTIFLDEIGELPLALQSKLLRVLQEGEFERLGGTKTIKVDVRVIAATNRDLEEEVKKGTFRKDLWYRLNVFPITAPPLRDRAEDIALLARYFTDRFAKKQRKTINYIPSHIIEQLEGYSWPGNVRELENVIERAVINTTGDKLNMVDDLCKSTKQVEKKFQSMEAMERDYIFQVLEATNWKVSGKNSASEILGLKRSTLRAKIDKLNITKL
ncbi:sigma 54-interacting transcriptional regulator [Desulforhopalus sp. IMCC35007]|uniref:sigma 54-interacting transcriptional regulator n=1 Tax=Desulforhopalus sp. IMCC35007 TaxID=2569543 RepID=UPI0010AE6F84|nr:sigma 54-interacting transcriptional regulator [Desulforhopalus sp. IMCC35007]TKB07283.1 PAS domain S-box protein [Desulforhopalus sp. IMCC35007]